MPDLSSIPVSAEVHASVSLEASVITDQSEHFTKKNLPSLKSKNFI
ncbi:MAG: hypothetical protein GWP32_08965 [Bacteroidetes bacterium]|nr:hypothetical protein [Bacteroidota bacterium]